MHMTATKVKFLDDVKLELAFRDGTIIRYNMAVMFLYIPN